MAAQVKFEESNKQFPIEIELKGECLVLTKNAAIELKNKLQKAIDAMLEHEEMSEQEKD
jgi:hypothetical protein